MRLKLTFEDREQRIIVQMHAAPPGIPCAQSPKRIGACSGNDVC